MAMLHPPMGDFDILAVSMASIVFIKIAANWLTAGMNMVVD
jgi:hypothetical protein